MSHPCQIKCNGGKKKIVDKKCRIYSYIWAVCNFIDTVLGFNLKSVVATAIGDSEQRDSEACVWQFEAPSSHQTVSIFTEHL